MASVEDRMREYEDAYSRYKDFAGQEAKFRQGLEETLKERLGFNKDLIEQKNALTSQRQMLPSQLRQEYAGSAIVNPLAQEGIIEGRRSTLGQQIGNVQDLLGERGQYVSDILGRGTTQFQSELAARSVALDKAKELLAMAREDEARRRAAAAAAAQQSALADYLASLQGDQEDLGLTPEQEDAIEKAAFADERGVSVDSIYKLPGGGYATFDPNATRKGGLKTALMTQFAREVMPFGKELGLASSSPRNLATRVLSLWGRGRGG